MSTNTEISPEFLIAGASKAGTEWLRMCLREHPQVYIPDGPTLDYFSEYYHKGDSWYLSHFREAAEKDVVVEKSTSYMVHNESAERIFNFNPNMEFIFILRDPIERAYSHYCMHFKAGRVTGKTSEEITEGSRYVNEGFYYRYLKRFENIFSENSINVLLFDDLKEDPKAFWKDVLSILGVDKHVLPEMVEQKYHTRKSVPKFKSTYRGIVECNRYVRKKSELYNALFINMQKLGAAKIFHSVMPSEDFPNLSDEHKVRLKKVYEEDYKKLKGYLDRDISFWMNVSQDSASYD